MFLFLATGWGCSPRSRAQSRAWTWFLRELVRSLVGGRGWFVYVFLPWRGRGEHELDVARNCYDGCLLFRGGRGSVSHPAKAETTSPRLPFPNPPSARQVAISEQYLIPKARKDHGMDKVRTCGVAGRERSACAVHVCYCVCSSFLSVVLFCSMFPQPRASFVPLCDARLGANPLRLGSAPFFFILYFIGMPGRWGQARSRLHPRETHTAVFNVLFCLNDVLSSLASMPLPHVNKLTGRSTGTRRDRDRGDRDAGEVVRPRGWSAQPLQARRQGRRWHRVCLSSGGRVDYWSGYVPRGWRFWCADKGEKHLISRRTPAGRPFHATPLISKSRSDDN